MSKDLNSHFNAGANAGREEQVQVGNGAPKKWLTDKDWNDRFNEERDAKQDYNDEDQKAFEQHVHQFKLIMHLAPERRNHFRKDPGAVDRVMDILKDYNPTREQVTDVLKRGRNKNFGQIHDILDQHLGSN